MLVCFYVVVLDPRQVPRTNFVKIGLYSVELSNPLSNYTISHYITHQSLQVDIKLQQA